MWQESQYLQSSGLDSGIQSGTTTRGPGSISGFGFDPKMEIPVAANTSGDLYDMNRAGYDQGYTQQEVEGKEILYILLIEMSPNMQRKISYTVLYNSKSFKCYIILKLDVVLRVSLF